MRRWPWASPFVTDSIRYDQNATADARQRAREALPEEMKEIYAGQIIQDRGKPWTAQSRADVKTYLRLVGERPKQRVAASLIAHSVLVALVLICLWRVAYLLGGRRHAAALSSFVASVALRVGGHRPRRFLF